MKKQQVKWFAVLAILVCCGCATNAPLDTLYYTVPEGGQPKTMLILLRGRIGSHTIFEKEGMIDDVRTRKLPIDIAAPEAGLGYYVGRTLVPRLQEDIIEPAKAKGYQRFWLVGFSMGGLGSLMYTREFADEIAGVCVVSPFLGYRSIIDEIETAGGLLQWEPGDYDPEEDWQRMFWHWLKRSADDGPLMEKIYLGYGTEDSFVKAQRLLEAILPDGHVITTEGGHTQEIMKALWVTFLDQGVIR
jgi:pimeloyl-ACP methyl ester carboxylesterase